MRRTPQKKKEESRMIWASISSVRYTFPRIGNSSISIGRFHIYIYTFVEIVNRFASFCSSIIFHFLLNSNRSHPIFLPGHSVD